MQHGADPQTLLAGFQNSLKSVVKAPCGGTSPCCHVKQLCVDTGVYSLYVYKGEEREQSPE